jgi:hypothetical protein
VMVSPSRGGAEHKLICIKANMMSHISIHIRSKAGTSILQALDLTSSAP